VLKDKKTIYIDKRAKIGKNVIIYENCRIDGACEIEDNVTIFPNCFISNSIIGKGAKIYSSIIENSKIGTCCSVGPFCHIRGGKIGEFAHIGDFSVLKQAIIQKSQIVEPFSYLIEEKSFNKNKKGN